MGYEMRRRDEIYVFEANFLKTEHCLHEIFDSTHDTGESLGDLGALAENARQRTACQEHCSRTALSY
jgi:hypothetical protein